MPDEAALLAAIAAAPADDAPRLAYADWLAEQGRAEQAEAIRAEHLARTALARWEVLKPRMDPDWLARVFPAPALVLRAYPPTRKIAVIKAIIDHFAVGLADAKQLSESLPARLKGKLTRADLEKAQADFAGLEAVTEIESVE